MESGKDKGYALYDEVKAFREACGDADIVVDPPPSNPSSLTTVVSPGDRAN